MRAQIYALVLSCLHDLCWLSYSKPDFIDSIYNISSVRRVSYYSATPDASDGWWKQKLKFVDDRHCLNVNLFFE